MNTSIFPVITENDKKLPFYLLRASRNWNQEHVICPDGYFYQWIQCVKGEGELISNGKKYRIKEGNAMLLMKGITHEYYAITEPWVVDWIVFDGTQVEYFIKNIANINASCALYVSRPDIFTAKIQSVLENLQSGSMLNSLKCSNIVYSLLTDMVQYSSVTPDNSIDSQHYRLNVLFQYIEENYNKLLTLDELAQIAGVTPEHLCTIFKKATDVRIVQYINSFRIKKSKELLIHNPALPVKEVASLTGFEDVNYFCSVFKKLENVTPGQFRKLNNTR